MGVKSGAYTALVHDRCLVAGLEPGYKNGIAIGANRERARSIGEKSHDPDRSPAQRGAEMGRIEHPDVRARNTGGVYLRIAGALDSGDRGIGALLPAMRRGDEGAAG